jgi:hypothetical protein
VAGLYSTENQRDCLPDVSALERYVLGLGVKERLVFRIMRLRARFWLWVDGAVFSRVAAFHTSNYVPVKECNDADNKERMDT